MLNRVHRQARPRADIRVPVMQRVGQLIQRWPVQQAVYPVEMERNPHRRHKEQCHEPHRILRPLQHRGIAVGDGPQQQHLVSGPEEHAAGQGPEHIVLELAVQREGAALVMHVAGVEFQLFFLCLTGVQHVMQPARDDSDEDRVTDEHQRDPAGREGLGEFERGLKVKPCQHRQRGNNRVLPEHKPPRRKPLHIAAGLGRPLEQRRGLDRHVRPIIPLLRKAALGVGWCAVGHGVLSPCLRAGGWGMFGNLGMVYVGVQACILAILRAIGSINACIRRESSAD